MTETTMAAAPHTTTIITEAAATVGNPSSRSRDLEEEMGTTEVVTTEETMMERTRDLTLLVRTTTEGASMLRTRAVAGSPWKKAGISPNLNWARERITALGAVVISTVQLLRPLRCLLEV